MQAAYELQPKFGEVAEAWRQSLGKIKSDDELWKYLKTPTDMVMKLAKIPEMIDETIHFKGHFACVSNTLQTAQETLCKYGTRDSIEKYMRTSKSVVGLDTVRAHKNETLNGQLLVSFIAVGIASWLIHQMRNEPKATYRYFNLPLSYSEMIRTFDSISMRSDVDKTPHFNNLSSKHKAITDTLGFGGYLATEEETLGLFQ